MKVRDFMITKVFTINPSNMVKELLQILNSNRIGGVPVVDEKDHVIQEKLDTPVKDIMTKRNLLYVLPDEDFDKAIRLLSRHHFKKLPVVNGAGRVIGVLSRGDIIHNISKRIISS